MQGPDPGENTDEDEEDSDHLIKHYLIKPLLVFTYICLGAYRYVPGATFIDLSRVLRVHYVVMPLLYTSRATGYIVGYTVGPFLFARILRSTNQFLLICLFTFFLALACFVISMVETFNTLAIIFAISGVCFAVIDISTNALMEPPLIKPNHMFFYILHFFYAFGSVSSTLAARVYIRKGVNATDVPGATVTAVTNIQFWSENIFPIKYVYIILSSLIFILSLLWLAIYCFRSFNSSFTVILEEENTEILHRSNNFIAVFNFLVLNFIGGGLDFGYVQVLPIHCMLNMKMVQEEALDQAIEFLGFFCLGRFTETLIASKVHANSMLFLGCVLGIISSFLLYLSKDLSPMYFYIGNAMLGFGCASYYPTLLSWVRAKMFIIHENYILYEVMACVSELVVPVLLIRLVINTYPLHYFVFGASSIYCLLLIIQHLLFHRRSREPTYSPQEYSQSVMAHYLTSNVFQTVNYIPKTVRSAIVTPERELSIAESLTRLSDINTRVRDDNRTVVDVLKSLEYSAKKL